jgi:small-conductance mechanosensitive channel
LRVWAAKEDFLQTRDELTRAVKRRFDQEGIEIPFPHLSLYTGEATKPFPIMHQEPMVKPVSNDPGENDAKSD